MFTLNKWYQPLYVALYDIGNDLQLITDNEPCHHHIEA